MSDKPVNGDSLPNGFRELDEAERSPSPQELNGEERYPLLP